MYELFIAVIAIIFFTIIMPLLDTLSIFIQSAINKKIHSWQVDMSLEDAEAQAATEVISPTQTNVQAIGFQVPQEYNGEEWCNK